MYNINCLKRKKRDVLAAKTFSERSVLEKYNSFMGDVQYFSVN